MEKIKLNNKRVIITGAAGFIGANLVMELLHNNETGESATSSTWGKDEWRAKLLASG